jgi:PTH1 family peptidyl-tRNA hydrolase
MKLILAQGNIGPNYDKTRHNVGFLVLDKFAAQSDLTWKEKPKFNALITELTIDNEKILLIKPTTYYNETGVSAHKLIDFYNLNPTQDLLVIHDDLALPFGTIRTRNQGSDAGNNGIKSINASIGTNYHRIRIGIANDQRPMIDDSDFVLGKFSLEESEKIPEIINKATDIIDSFIAGSIDLTTLN